MIKATGLSRRYGQFLAVDNVSFEIPKGQIVGLLGHNGAGKTTIMKMLTGYLEPTAGEVIVDGVNLADDRLAVQRKIGYLPENCPIYHEMTVLDYLGYVAKLKGIPNSEQRDAILRVVARTHLTEKATSLISALSKGYMQRVGVAQAMIHSPQILILDEPTNGLDPSQIQGMRSLIQELGQLATVIISTHILQEVQAVCERVLIMRQGKLALDSRLEDLRSSNQIIVGIGEGAQRASKALNGVRDVSLVNERGVENGTTFFSLTVANQSANLCAEVAKVVMKEGCSLVSLYPERRSLETVFSEINQVQGGSDAR